MKRTLLALLLIAVLSLSLVACSNGNQNGNDNTDNNVTDPNVTTPDDGGTMDLPNNNNDNTEDDTPLSAWGQHSVFGGIPEYNLGGTHGDFMDEDDHSYVDIQDVKDEDYKSYMAMLRDNGYEKESETGNEMVYYNAETGSRVMLSYNANNDNLLRITSYPTDTLRNLAFYGKDPSFLEGLPCT